MANDKKILEEFENKPAMVKLRTIHAAKLHAPQLNAERKLREAFKWIGSVTDVTVLQNGYEISRIENASKAGGLTFAVSKELIGVGAGGETFEQALCLVVAHSLSGKTEAGWWMHKLAEQPKEPNE